MRTSFTELAVLSLLVACGPSGGEPEKAVPPVATPAPAAAPGKTEAPAKTEASAVTGDAATPPAPEPAEEVAEAEAPAKRAGRPKFWLAAERQGELRVFDLGTEVIVGGAGALARLREDGSLERMPDTLRGQVDPGYMYLAGWGLEALGGRWPDPVWMFTQTHYNRSDSVPRMYYRKGDRWQRKATAVGQLHWYYKRFAPWRDGQVLALRAMMGDPEKLAQYGIDVPEAVSRRIDAALAKNPPRIDVLVAGAPPAATAMRLEPGWEPIALAAAPTGEVFVMLSQGVPWRGDVKYAVQRFDVAGKGVFERPVADDERVTLAAGTLVARAHDEAYVAGRREPDGAGVVMKFDGQGWRSVAAPPGGVSVLASGGDAMWAVAENTGERSAPDEELPAAVLLRRVGAGAWKKVALPQVGSPMAEESRWYYSVEGDGWAERKADPVEAATATEISPKHLLARGADDLWVVGTRVGVLSADGNMDPHVVLRAREVPRSLAFPDDSTLRGELRDLLPPDKPGGEGGLDCMPYPWIVVETLAASAPDDAGVSVAEALERAASKEALALFYELREARVEGKRVVGLHANVEQDEQAKTVLAALTAYRPGERRRWECRDPKPLRVLKKYEENAR